MSYQNGGTGGHVVFHVVKEIVGDHDIVPWYPGIPHPKMRTVPNLHNKQLIVIMNHV